MVYDLSARARAAGAPFAEAARAHAAEHGFGEEIALDPSDYLGEAEAIVTTAVERWRDSYRPAVAAP